jgi:glutamyl-tRNA reductase
VVLGLSHKTASVDIREKLAVQEGDWQVRLTLVRLVSSPPEVEEEGGGGGGGGVL